MAMTASGVASTLASSSSHRFPASSIVVSLSDYLTDRHILGGGLLLGPGVVSFPSWRSLDVVDEHPLAGQLVAGELLPAVGLEGFDREVGALDRGDDGGHLRAPPGI